MFFLRILSLDFVREIETLSMVKTHWQWTENEQHINATLPSFSHSCVCIRSQRWGAEPSERCSVNELQPKETQFKTKVTFAAEVDQSESAFPPVNKRCLPGCSVIIYQTADPMLLITSHS